MADHKLIFKLSEALVRKLAAFGKTVSTAESCTGGWLAKAITDVAGSSDVFAYGIVSYSNDAKESLLGVNSATLTTYGAVSEAVVAEMARGAINLSGADFSVAVSGVAGPGGGSDEKPVGTVWFAWATKHGSAATMTTERLQFTGDRDLIRERTVAHALEGLIERI